MLAAPILVLALCAEPAPVPPPASADAPPAAEAVRPGDEGLFALRGGGTIAGRLVSSGPDGDVVEVDSGTRLRLPPGAIVGRARAAPARAGPPPRAGEYRVFMRDGRTLRGEIVAREGGRLRLRQADGTVLELAEADVRETFDTGLLREDRGGPADVSAGRGLAVTTALGLERDAWRVGLGPSELPTASYGATSWLTLSASATHGFVVGGALGSPALLATATAHAAVLRPWLRVAGGLRAGAGEGGVTAVLLGAVTVGSPSTHLTLYAGPPLPEASRLGRFDAVVLAASGTARVLRHVALLGEGWLSPGESELLGAFAVRWVERRCAIDAGAMLSSSGDAAPWIAFSFAGARGGR